MDLSAGGRWPRRRNNMVLDAGIEGRPLIAPGDYRGAEFADATFSPVGDELFVRA